MTLSRILPAVFLIGDTRYSSSGRRHVGTSEFLFVSLSKCDRLVLVLRTTELVSVVGSCWNAGSSFVTNHRVRSSSTKRKQPSPLVRVRFCVASPSVPGISAQNSMAASDRTSPQVSTARCPRFWRQERCSRIASDYAR